MRFISTRGQASAVGFTDAVLGGLAPDGGLYVPQEWPSFTKAQIAAFAGMPYAQVAAEVLGAFAGDEISRADMLAMCEEAYATFSHKAVVPMVQIGPQTFIAELFHGPSLAFKDVAMQILARLYDHLLGQQGRKQTILCATSGDTGGAAVEAFRGAKNVRVVAMFPEGRISEVQRRFMTTAEEANIACVAVKGTFDDCQAILKDAFQDLALRQAVDLAAVNSINFARIAAQAVYYFTTAAALGAPARPINFVVPSGNFGDAFAGYVAMRMGLPIKQIVVATNSNDILARAFATGRYSRGTVQATLSPAMDIQSASNFERLYFEGVTREPEETARAFQAFAKAGVIDIPPGALAAMRTTFSGVAIGEEETVRAIVSTLNETGELIDPHTAVAVAALRHVELDGPTVVMSTAHPAKFPEDVAKASGVTPDLPRGTANLAGRKERFDRLPGEADTIKAYVRAFAEAEGLAPKVHALANGVRVICDPLPGWQTVALSVVAGRGARYEDAAHSGWSHLLEHMVFKGAGGRSAKAIVEVIEAEGGHINAATGYERTSFQVRALKGGLDLGSAVISDLVLRPQMDAADLAREKQVVGQEIAEAADTPDDLVFELAQAAAFAGQPLGRPILGTAKSIGTATAETLGAWRADLYAPSSLIVSAAGAVDEDDLLKLAERDFGGASGAGLPEPQDAAFAGGTKTVARKLEQANLVLLLPAVGVKDADYFALRLLAEILGGGMASRLFQEAREVRGLAYAIDAYSETYADTGLLGVFAGCAAGDAAELAEVTAQQLKGLTEPVGAAELSRAKAQLKGSMFMGRESALARAEQNAGQALLFGHTLEPESIADEIDAVTPAQLAALTERILAPGKAAVAVLGPRAALKAAESFDRALFG